MSQGVKKRHDSASTEVNVRKIVLI